MTAGGVCRSPFDPFEDTESVAGGGDRYVVGLRRSPFDPFEDTESEGQGADRARRRGVAAHSIRSRILKAEQAKAKIKAAAVAAHSIRSRILKGALLDKADGEGRGRSPFDPFEDTERNK